MTPLVSVVTPSLNQGEFLEETILSVKCQDYPNIEHIVIDGGSSDKTLEILRRHEPGYNLRWVSEPDQGQSHAINKGFDLARGEIIGWLNSDDVYFDKGVISYIVEAFDGSPASDIIYGDAAFIDEGSFIRRIYKAPDWDYSRLLVGSCYIAQPATFLRKEVVSENRLDQRLDFSMDIEFWLRLGTRYTFSHVDRVLAGDRLHKGAKRLSNNTLGRYRAESRQVRRKFGQRFDFKYYVQHYVLVLHMLCSARLGGVSDMLRLERTNEMAFDGQFPSRLFRVWTQLSPFDDIRYACSDIKSYRLSIQCH